MVLPDPATLQLAAAWVALVAAAGGLVNLLLGLFTVATGRDHWPKQLQRFRRRKPASQEDLRRHAMSLVLNGAAVLIIIMSVSINTFGARDHSQGEPLITLRFVLTLVGMAGAMACVISAYAISRNVTYISTRLPPARDPLPL
jgi:amino acid transporter